MLLLIDFKICAFVRFLTFADFSKTIVHAISLSINRESVTAFPLDRLTITQAEE